MSVPLVLPENAAAPSPVEEKPSVSVMKVRRPFFSVR